jgi:DNA-binding NarL/FixJ family response regulator
MLGAGASGYLLKDCAFEELAQAVRVVAKGQTYLSPAIAGAPAKGYAGGRVDEGDLARAAEEPSAYLPAGTPAAQAGPPALPRSGTVLAPMERQVLQLLAEGKEAKQMAACLRVSVARVEEYRERLMQKLGVRSTAELIGYAVREGLASPEPS